MSDDPRPHTDAESGGETEDLTGTDLVMRELGGRVIEEITDVSGGAFVKTPITSDPIAVCTNR